MPDKAHNIPNSAPLPNNDYNVYGETLGMPRERIAELQKEQIARIKRQRQQVQEEKMSELAIYRDLRTEFVGKNILYLPVTTSTMDIAKQAVSNRAAEGTIVITDEQTAGRGRAGRKWLSPPGSSILLSIIVKPNLAQLSRLNMVAALATAQAIEKTTGIKPTIKWPNDIIIEGKKVSGMLIEGDIQDEVVNSAVVGIGVNITLDPSTIPEIKDTATSLRVVLREEVSRLEVLRALLLEFEQLYKALLHGEDIHKKWLRRLETLGRQVRVKMGDEDEELEGYAESVDSEGHLWLRRPDESLVEIIAGDVMLRT